MKRILKLAKAELQMLFYSPVAWLILVIFTFQVTMEFCNTFENLVKAQELKQGLKELTLGIFSSRDGLFNNILSYLYFYIPVLTMGLMSREYSSGSIKLLYAAPIRNSQIILGKFLSVMIYALVMLAIVGVFVIYSCFAIHKFDIWPILCGMFGIYLTICAYAAIGLFMSCLTSYQIIAAVGTFATLAALSYLPKIWQDYALVRDITFWLGINGRSAGFVSGLISSDDLIYFIVVIGLFITMSIFKLSSMRYKYSAAANIGRYVLLFAIVISVGLISTQPSFKKYYDTTRTKVRTLTKTSQEIVGLVDDQVTITTYVNMLDSQYDFAMPKNWNIDKSRFEQYLRFLPDIKMKYVYYYAKTDNEILDKNYPKLTDRERMVRVSSSYKMDTLKIMPKEEIDKIIDLSGENYHTVRVIERANGRKTFLRLYDDLYRHPFETEISAAFKRLVMDEFPLIGFVEGHGERSSVNLMDRDYAHYAGRKKFRNALINQGFDHCTVDLSKPVSQKIATLVIAEMRTKLSEQEIANLDEYIKRGGNILIMCEPKRIGPMNELIERFGVKLIPGTLASTTNPRIQSDLMLCKPTAEAGKEIAYHFRSMLVYKNLATMPSAAGLDYSKAKELGFKVTDLFRCDSTTWNELQTQDFVEDTPQYNPETGETKGAVTTAIALSRQINNRQQRIAIFGDADCLSNGEIMRNRKRISARNNTVADGIFFWLSDYNVPVDVRRPWMPDDKINIGKTGMLWTNILLRWTFPIILAIFGIMLNIRRKSN